MSLGRRLPQPFLYRGVRRRPLLALALQFLRRETLLEHAGNFFRLHPEPGPDFFCTQAILALPHEGNDLVEAFRDLLRGSTRESARLGGTYQLCSAISPAPS